MQEDEYTAEEKAFQVEVARHFRWNFAVNALDGAFFWFAVNFVAPSTILPLYVRHLTDSRLVIGLVGTIAGAGWYLPQLLTANYVARQPRKKPLVTWLGFFAERLPYLVMAVSAFILAGDSPGPAVAWFLLTFAWHTLGAGSLAVAWQEMVARVIPVRYRGRLLGIANFGGTAAGLFAAAWAAAILDRYPFPTNFALCFGLGFLFMMVSWFFLALTREPPLHARRSAISLGEFRRRLPTVLRSDRNFASYLWARVITVIGRMGMGFLTVYAAERWALSDSQAGYYAMLLLLGQATGNILFGPLADRRGHKVVSEISVAIAALSMVGAVLAPSSTWLYPVFAAVGALNASDILSMIGIVMEFAGPEDRPTYIGLANTIPGLFAAVAPVIGGWIASRSNYTMTFLTGALLSVFAWCVLHWAVREPRASADLN
jgi:MFS family permease